MSNGTLTWGGYGNQAMGPQFSGQGTSTAASGAGFGNFTQPGGQPSYNYQPQQQGFQLQGMQPMNLGSGGSGGAPANQPPPPPKQKAVQPTGSAWGDIATGVTNVIMSQVDKKKKRNEQRAATREHNLYKNRYQQLDTSNPYEGLENPYEDLTINKQQAEFQAQQEQQGMANTMQSLQGAAGGSGIAGLAQALSNQQSQNLQRASASIGQQERQNQMTKAAFTARRDEQGVMAERQMKRESTETMFGMAQQRKAAADEAANTTEMLVGGLNQIGAGVGGLFMPQGS